MSGVFFLSIVFICGDFGRLMTTRQAAEHTLHRGPYVNARCTFFCAGYGLLLKQCTFSAGVMYALWVSLDRPEDPFWWV
jgi:hypothetical protein